MKVEEYKTCNRNVQQRRGTLKGQCHEIFCFWFFHESVSPPSPRVSHQDRFEFFRKFAEIFASDGAPPVWTTPVANLPPVSTTPAANFATSFASFVDTVANLPPVSTTPAANLPPVSTTPLAICHRYQRHRRQICRRCQWHRWQIMGTISGCLDLKVSLKAKMFL